MRAAESVLPLSRRRAVSFQSSARPVPAAAGRAGIAAARTGAIARGPLRDGTRPAARAPRAEARARGLARSPPTAPALAERFRAARASPGLRALPWGWLRRWRRD